MRRRVERGVPKNPTKQVSLLTLDKICGALDCAPGELLEREVLKRKGRG